MALTNYRDISPPASDMHAGFQFEFFCESCGETWKIAVQALPAGQAASVFRNFGYLFNEFYRIGAHRHDLQVRPGEQHVDRGDRIEGEAGGARGSPAAGGAALRAMRQLPHAGSAPTATTSNTGLCIKCEAAAGQSAGAGGGAASSAAVCPNCQTPSQGGRFCHECGFDMASTHKSCPGVRHRRAARRRASAPTAATASDAGARARHRRMADPRTEAESAVRAGDPRAALAAHRGGARQAGRRQPAHLPGAAAVRARPVGARPHPAQRRRRPGSPAVPMRETVGHAIRCELMRAAGLRRQAHADGVRPARRMARAADRVAAAAGPGQRGRWRATWLRRAFDAAPAGRRQDRRASRSNGSPTPTRASGRCSRPASTAATTGCRSRACRASTFDAPEDLRDCVWMPAQLVFGNGGETVALVPTRYPGVARPAATALICLARKTEWADARRRIAGPASASACSPPTPASTT